MKIIPYSFSKRGELVVYPQINRVVWRCYSDQVDMRLVIITKVTDEGCYYNWTWQEIFDDGTLSREETGGSHFYEYYGNYTVERSVKLIP